MIVRLNAGGSRQRARARAVSHRALSLRLRSSWLLKGDVDAARPIIVDAVNGENFMPFPSRTTGSYYPPRAFLSTRFASEKNETSLGATNWSSSGSTIDRRLFTLFHNVRDNSHLETLYEPQNSSSLANDLLILLFITNPIHVCILSRILLTLYYGSKYTPGSVKINKNKVWWLA